MTLLQSFGKTSPNRICFGSSGCRRTLSWNKRWDWYKYLKLTISFIMLINDILLRCMRKSKNTERHFYGFVSHSSTGMVFWIILTINKITVNGRKPENNTIQRYKNTKAKIVNLEGTRMVKDGEDWHRLQTMKMKNSG